LIAMVVEYRLLERHMQCNCADEHLPRCERVCVRVGEREKGPRLHWHFDGKLGCTR
jgi:hypothetical protein